MNHALTFAPSPATRALALMSEIANDLFATPPRRPAGARRTAGPAAEMLRTLPARATLTVEQPLGLDVLCLKGTLWVTHDGDTIDHVVESGSSYTAKRGERMLIHALTEARFVVGPNSD